MYTLMTTDVEHTSIVQNTLRKQAASLVSESGIILDAIGCEGEIIDSRMNILYWTFYCIQGNYIKIIDKVPYMPLSKLLIVIY